MRTTVPAAAAALHDRTDEFWLPVGGLPCRRGRHPRASFARPKISAAYPAAKVQYAANRGGPWKTRPGAEAVRAAKCHPASCSGISRSWVRAMARAGNVLQTRLRGVRTMNGSGPADGPAGRCVRAPGGVANGIFGARATAGLIQESGDGHTAKPGAGNDAHEDDARGRIAQCQRPSGLRSPSARRPR
jgi:hypothetical protein